MIFRRVVPLFLSALSPLTAADFPVVPRSERLLTEADVKDFWIDRLQSMPPLPDRMAASPDAEIAEKAEIARRDGLIEEIREGRHDVAARLVCLSHNVEAWSRQGNAGEAEKAEAGLLRLRERLARLAILEARYRDLARREINGEGEALSREIRRLKASLRQRDEAV